MNNLPELKLRLSQFSNEDLIKMVNEDIVKHEKEEITLAYAELDRRGMLPKPPAKRSDSGVSLIDLVVGVVVFIIEHFLLPDSAVRSGGLWSRPRGVALAVFVAMLAGHWHRRESDQPFWKYLLWCAGVVLLGSVALWDLPNLLRQRIPVELAFGIPTLIYAIAWHWFSKVLRPSWQTRFIFWLIGCIIFTLFYVSLVTDKFR
jgi:hypothetical protein